MSNTKGSIYRLELSQCIYGCQGIMNRRFLKRKKKRKIDIEIVINIRDIILGVTEVELIKITIPTNISINIGISSMVIINFGSIRVGMGMKRRPITSYSTILIDQVVL